MSDPETLSLADLERGGRVWGSGRERRALCPFCGDDHKRDQGHAALAVNVETGAWHCHRCDRSGLLDEHKTPHDDPLRSGSRRRRRTKPSPRSAPPFSAPPADLADKRETLRRLWAQTVPIDAAAASAGAAYLDGRTVPVAAAIAGRVRFAGDWYGRPAVVFPVQDAAGRLVAAEARYIDAGTPKSRSAGRKSGGVFVASPGALDCDGLCVCEGPITALSLAAVHKPAIALCGKHRPPWLASRLALRNVFVALDYDEQGADKAAAAFAAELVALAGRPWRLRTPAGFAGDWNDYLAAYGREPLREALDAALVRAFV